MAGLSGASRRPERAHMRNLCGCTGKGPKATESFEAPGAEAATTSTWRYPHE